MFRFFARREKPVHGHVRLRIPFGGSGLVQFTLDEPQRGKRVVWYACWADLALRNGGSVDSTVQELVERGVDIVGMRVPSAMDVQLEARVDRSGAEPEIVCVGALTYLPSEWDAVKGSGSLGEVLAERV